MTQQPRWAGHHELHGRSLVGGDWIDGSNEPTERANPATADALSSVRLLALPEVQRAIAAAARAKSAWSRAPFHTRADLLSKAADTFRIREDELAELLTLEQGKTLAESRIEVRRGAQVLRFFAAEADRQSGEVFNSPRPDEHIRVVHPPRGTVALITPWNFPVAIPIWKLAPALVYGNSVVWKPASIVPALSALIARILQDAGLPDGVLNLAHCGPSVAEELVRSADIDAVSFTGSTAVGTRIIQAAAPTRTAVQAEMGGKNVTIVMADADLSLVIDALVEGSMGSAGQRCTASERVLVDARVADSLIERLAARVEALRVGDGLDPATEVGPVATIEAKRQIAGAFDTAVAQGARRVAAAPADDAHPGNFVAPSVFEIQDTSSSIWCDEVFGPVVAIRRFETFDEAVALANATPYGLSGSVFSDSHSLVERASVELRVGILHINSATIGADPHVPFGGTGASGYGPKEQGRAARDFYTESRTIYEKWVTASE